MRLALRLARRGYGTTSPNPMVGAVLVKGGKIIGRGWHRRAGLPHAEIEALRDAQKRGHHPRGASLYVTLEPCSTHGRTPPCTDAIIAAGVKRVVVGAVDPNPNHSGRGFKILRRAGIAVTKVGSSRRDDRTPQRSIPTYARAAVVVPNGTLFGDGVCARIKEELIKEFNLHTIVRLPNGVFAPYTGITTNILFFDRSGPTKKVWYYEHPLPEGRKNYTKTAPIQFDEFAPCIAWWKKRKDPRRRCKRWPIAWPASSCRS